MCTVTANANDHKSDAAKSRYPRCVAPQHLTNAHSKKQRNHDAIFGLYFAWYNFCRKHMAIKMTPAMKAEIADEQWSLKKLRTVAASA